MRNLSLTYPITIQLRGMFGPRLMSTRLPKPTRNKKPAMSYKCDYCPKEFPSKSQVEFHMKKMNDQKKLYSCNKMNCSFVAYYLCVWNDHRMTVHHNEEVKVVLQGLSQADLINKEAWTQWKRHANPMIDLKKLKPHLHVCDKCEKSFFTKAKLKDHKINKHTRWS